MSYHKHRSAPVDTVPPVADAPDQRKSAAMARGGVIGATEPVCDFATARRVLRDEAAVQAGFKADVVKRMGGADKAPILFMRGDAHRRQRAATARFFAPRVVATRYRQVMEATTATLIARLRRDGAADLDAMAMELAVTVAADIVGLTESDRAGMTRRLEAFFETGVGARTDRLSLFVSFWLGQVRMWRFYRHDVRPAITARRAHPGEDVISHLLADGYSARRILTECFTYGAAGMVTTREFITMAGWHLLEDADLRARFLAAGEDDRIALLEELLRLEPVVGTLYRRLPGEERPRAIDIRAVNADAAAVGACPHRLDPDRAVAAKVPLSGMAFGDGPHRCPGAGVAMHESAIFLAALLQVPGIRLERAPAMGWNPLITGYELRGARIACDP